MKLVCSIVQRYPAWQLVVRFWLSLCTIVIKLDHHYYYYIFALSCYYYYQYFVFTLGNIITRGVSKIRSNTKWYKNVLAGMTCHLVNKAVGAQQNCVETLN